MKKRHAKKYGQPTAKKNPAGAPINIVQTKLDVQPFNRGDKDTTSWRTAMQSAESRVPRRTLLYDLYADVELDGHVEAVTSKRKDAVTSTNWQFLDSDGKPVDDINDIIDSIGFETLLEEIVSSKFWGYSIFEPKFYKSHTGKWEMDANLIPRKNMRPELGIVAYESIGEEGINIRSGIYTKTIMEVGKVKDLGLYLKCAIPALLKRGGISDFAMFVQVFGQPIVDAVWNGYDEEQRIKLNEAITSLGSGGGIVRPEGTKVELLDKSATASGQLQATFLKFLDDLISKAILGSTETTESSKSSGYAQSKTHENQDNKKFKTDRRFTRRILNSRFVKILEAHGFDLKGGSFSIKEEDENISKKDWVKIHETLRTKIGLPIDDDFLYDAYGIPKPENYDQIKKEKETLKPKQKTDPPEKEKEAEPKTKSNDPKEKEVKLSLSDKLIKLASDFFRKASEKEANPKMKDCCGEIHTNLITLQANEEPQINYLLKAVKKANGKGYLYPELFAYNIDPLTEAFSQGWNGDGLIKLTDFGIEYGIDDKEMKAAWELNLFKFSTVKAAYQSAEVNALFRQAKNFNEFERMVRKLYGVTNKNHLRTEYNSAFQVGQSASTYQRLLAQADILPYWEYRTVGDDKVRESHRSLHGRILPANHPLWAKIFPPNDWNCRCYVVPRFSSEVDTSKVEADIAFVQNFIETSPAWEKAEQNGFGINRALTKEVFSAGQQYSDNPSKVTQKLKGLGFSVWGLLALAEMQKHATETQPNQEAQNLTIDYAGRTLAGNGLTEVAQNPDEVWASDNSLTYVKYYQDGSKQVIAELNEEGNLVANSFGDSSDSDRFGALVKSI